MARRRAEDIGTPLHRQLVFLAARARIAPAEPIVELMIPYALPDAADLVIDVQTR